MKFVKTVEGEYINLKYVRKFWVEESDGKYMVRMETDIRDYHYVISPKFSTKEEAIRRLESYIQTHTV